MTELSFRLPGELDLPVEVYDQRQRLVGRALTSDSVAVEPGRYFVEARLPDGTSRQRAVEVEGEVEQEIYLGPAERTAGFVASGFGVAPSGRWTEGLFRSEAEALAEAAEGSRAWLQGFRWRRLGGWQLVAREPVSRRESPRLDRFAEGGLDALGLKQPDGTTTLIPIPRGHSDLLRFGLVGQGDALRLQARVASDPAHALLSFLNLDLVGDAELLSHSRSLQGEYLLGEKVSDPIAAVAGAVALLRMNALDRLHDWTANLANWFPWLPDGAAVRAEHLALAGSHVEAAGLLRTLPDRGLPILSPVLGFAADRVRSYSAYWPDDLELRRTMELLTRYAVATDFSQPVTTFSGRDPDSPEGAWLEGDRRVNPGPEAVEEPAVAGGMA
jgi:hypothetical protein